MAVDPIPNLIRAVTAHCREHNAWPARIELDYEGVAMLKMQQHSGISLRIRPTSVELTFFGIPVVEVDDAASPRLVAAKYGKG